MPTKKTAEAADKPAPRSRSAAAPERTTQSSGRPDRNMIWAVSVLAAVVIFGAGYLVGDATGGGDFPDHFGLGEHHGMVIVAEGHCCRPGHEMPMMPPFYGEGHIVPMPGYEGSHPGVAGGGYLGIAGIDTGAGVQVVEVVPGSPADEAGVEPGDHIVSYHGVDVVSMEQLADLVAATAPGTEVELVIGGPGGGRIVTVEVGERP